MLKYTVPNEPIVNQCTDVEMIARRQMREKRTIDRCLILHSITGQARFQICARLRYCRRVFISHSDKKTFLKKALQVLLLRFKSLHAKKLVSKGNKKVNLPNLRRHMIDVFISLLGFVISWSCG